ncbi:AraC family transcriptional regulator [Sphingomonas sp. SAFR-052]|uniref:helix-turn-helix transcriptional regulator n=1 Tax=Sphingomonas sp. SAFR-052 TaxID=3436867 RepID=UPI003F7D664B
MRGQQRNAAGPERNAAPGGLLRFCSDDLPEADRVAQWREVVGRTLTGCTPSPLDGGALKVDFACIAGDMTRVAVTSLQDIRNHRDRDCLRDGAEDLVFFSLLGGKGRLDHRDRRTVLRPGEGVLAQFDRTIDTSWTRADLMLIRLAREALRGVDPELVLGALHAASASLMRLLQCYARVAWEEAKQTGALAPIADRHIAELIAALCTPHADEASVLARPAAGAARVAAMLEAIRRDYANPCLTMRDVAAIVGISERAGHLAFEKAKLSFSEELYRTRLERARERLLADNARVIDVAFAVGFSDSSHFYRLFKRAFGYSPSDLRTR